MHGYQRSQKNDLTLKLLLPLVVFVSLLVGCKSSEETKQAEETKTSFKDFLAKYEKSFNPSQYNPDVSVVKEEEKKLLAELEAASVATSVIPETIPGFRVQVFLTQEIDLANQMKDEIAKLLPDDWVYIVYDAPYYKVRVGNYAERPTANQMVKKLAENGYKDAWVVPDNVLKNPPPRPPDVMIEPENPLHRHPDRK